MNFNTLSIYLCGRMSGISFDQMNEWRQQLRQKIFHAVHYADADYKVKVINPVDYYNYEECKYQSQEEVEDFDLNLAGSCDLIVVNLDGLSESDGSKIEIHDCNYHKHIPVIGLGTKEDYEKLHPWTKRDITRYEETMDDVVRYIVEFYIY